MSESDNGTQPPVVPQKTVTLEEATVLALDSEREAERQFHGALDGAFEMIMQNSAPMSQVKLRLFAHLARLVRAAREYGRFQTVEQLAIAHATVAEAHKSIIVMDAPRAVATGYRQAKAEEAKKEEPTS